VLSTGGSLEPEQLGPLPPNVHAFDWIPQLEVLQAADCAVINAGTSVYECILQDVPMVVYSLRFNDQNGTAARIGYHGLGIVGDKDRDDAAKIREHLQRLLDDRAFRQRVASMRRSLRVAEADDRAVRAIERLLARGGTAHH
jgi:zeaxanthin glucosyltransferase